MSRILKCLVVGFTIAFSWPATAQIGGGSTPNPLSALITQGSSTANVLPFGELAAFIEPQNLFKDTFDTSFDTVNNWNAAVAAGGGIVVSQSPGQITLGTGTTANGYSYATTRPAFGTVQPGYVETGIAIKLPASIPTNSYAAWGTFTPTATPTAASPIAEGCGFELQPGGKMYVACYAGSTRTVIQDLSTGTGSGKQPIDGATHTYYQFFRGDIMAWAIDGIAASNIVATQNSGVNGPNVNTQPAALLAAAGTSAPSSSLTLTVAAVWVAVTNANGWIADGIYPYRKATVKAAGTAATSSDFPIVVTPMPGGASQSVAFSNQYPSGAVAVTASATGTTAATTATLAGVSGKTTYICGFTISADATTALAASATVTGTISGTMNYIQNVGAATAAGILTQTFNPCIPASAQNTGISINSAAAGIAGNTAVNGWGFQL